jgi:sulfur-carrier protein
LVKILYFSWVRDAIGVGEERIDVPAYCVTVHDLSKALAARSDGHARAFADPGKLRAAVDLAMVGFDAPIAGASEIAFFPPVTGG